MSSLTPKLLLFAELASLSRVLGNPHRLEIIELLAQADMAVEVLTERTGLSFANVSQHLQQLKKAGLVVGRRDGKRIVYQLSPGPIVEAVSGLRALAEHNVARVGDLVQTYFDRPGDLEAIGAAELLERMQGDAVTLLDVRPADEFAAGHLPGAINVTLEELEQRLSEFPDKREIVAYCRGPYCMLSLDAARALRQRGYTVRRLQEGLPEWRAAGYPVQMS
ncbi:ArsR family transcriptional regulator [Devosia epidermidihirudinis]|uniref:ArsR family transcriptional regulator n=1 Tax=Devosia epidermidihirudinis TaxID=1293439 RepID=A0A0F5QJX2_9HYPH|nr:metalloregulator ArsR/SmtB family transcription factor [Devosia epidermidihirudinis]KKC40998.1 ArsR family transcriptional regulator [Devosia epidermidihirudinis]